MTRSLEATNREERIQELQRSGGEIRFLSRLLGAPPDAALLADAHAVGLVEDGWEARVEQYRVEYTRLFSCPGPNFIPVNQSVYTDILKMEPSAPDPSGCGMAFPGGELRGYLGGTSCPALVRWYTEAAFTAYDGARQMPDHISLELDFAAHLCLAEAHALVIEAQDEAAAYRDLLFKFRQNFLELWLASFSQCVASNSVSSLYRRVGARLLELPTSLDRYNPG
ncbi:MAG: molecular chaperone TorD family protein [Acidobacteria bacterium]|nr:molecular chaperone TorD family protein [Acidobacteriota bacterium]